MTGTVAVAADLESFALVVRVDPDSTAEGVRMAVDASAAQHPTAVVLDLKPATTSPEPGPRLLRDRALLAELGRVCSRYAVPLVIVPTLAAAVALTSTSASRSPSTFPDVQNALAALPRIGTADSRTLTLAAIDAAPARARAVVAEELAAWSLEDLIFPAQLVVSELVSNAVLHGQPPVGLLVRRMEGEVLLGVHDRSGDPPRPTGNDPADTRMLTGRGLMLIPALAGRWGWLLGTDGKVVWARVSSPSPS